MRATMINRIRQKIQIIIIIVNISDGNCFIQTFRLISEIHFIDCGGTARSNFILTVIVRPLSAFSLCL